MKQFWILDFGLWVATSKRGNSFAFALSARLCAFCSFAVRMPALCAACVLAAATPAAAQRPKEIRIAVVGAPEEPRFSEIIAGLKKGLGEAGYLPPSLTVEEIRVARAEEKNVKPTVEKALKRGAQVLFLIGSRLLKPVREASGDVPVVFITPGDPVAAGLVASLARPGSNSTAMTFEFPELSGKRLELLKELAPRVRRVLAIYDPRDASPRQGIMAARQAAPGLGLTLVEREARSREDFVQGLQSMEGADAYLSVPGGLPTGFYREATRVANAKRLPTIFHSRSGSTVDALASYGANDAQVAHDAARLMAKILKGANAGELPVERPTKFELVINLKTAKQIGLTIPPNVLARADRVIR